MVPEEKKPTTELSVSVILSWCSFRGKIQRDRIGKLAGAALVLLWLRLPHRLPAEVSPPAAQCPSRASGRSLPGRAWAEVSGRAVGGPLRSRRASVSPAFLCLCARSPGIYQALNEGPGRRVGGRDQMDTAEQARQGHVSKHNRHALGNATRSGGPGEGDRSREHQVAEEDTG